MGNAEKHGRAVSLLGSNSVASIGEAHDVLLGCTQCRKANLSLLIR